MLLMYAVIALCVFAVAATGSFFTSAGMASYKCSNLPALAPGGAVISAVWIAD